jgi:hypothetical protein
VRRRRSEKPRQKEFGHRNGVALLVTGVGLALAGMQLVRAELPESRSAAPLAPDPAAGAFQRQVFRSLGGREKSAAFAVPEGTRLIIEYVSAGGGSASVTVTGYLVSLPPAQR